MKSLASGLLIAVGLVFCGFGPAAAQIVSDPGNPVERRAATASASEFLQLIDKGKIAQTWPRTGKYMQGIITQAGWEATIRSMRLAVGPLKSRTLTTAAFTKSIEGAPDGHYFVVFFDSSFVRANVEEKVVLNLEGTSWRVDGYFLTKKVEVNLGSR